MPLSISVLQNDIDARYARISSRMPPEEWALHRPLIEGIARLKRERRAVVMAHNYQPIEITHGIADVVGDSLALAQQAAATDAEVIVLCGVHFMAETAKILNPGRTVLIPDLAAGCSLASSITAADIRRLRASHPGAPVVSYVNTSAEVKAESDVCCTSANAVEIVESLPGQEVIFLPDRYLGRHVQAHTRKRLILWDGACEVHERFNAAEVRTFKAPGVRVLAHPECPPDVLAEADFVGSTAAMGGDIRRHRPDKVVLITECSMAGNLAVEFPAVEFTQPCNLCPHMQRITLPKVLRALETLAPEVTLDPATIAAAGRSLGRMLAVGRREAA